jgi:hypothetical protein
MGSNFADEINSLLDEANEEKEILSAIEASGAG